MTVTDTPNAEPMATPLAADLVQFGASGGAHSTIDFVFTGVELGEYLSDPSLHGDFTEWFAHAETAIEHAPVMSDVPTEDFAHPAFVYQSPSVIPGDDLLRALGDDAYQAQGPDVLETAARFGPESSAGSSDSFLLSEIDINDFLGDYGEPVAPAQSWNPELFDYYLPVAPAAHYGDSSPIMIEIEDGSGLAATPIVI